MGKSSSPAPTDSTVYQSSLPEYAEPYYTRLMDRAESESLREYTPYQGDRFAETAPETWMARDMVMGLQGIPGLTDAYDATMNAAQGADDLMNFQTGTYNPFDNQMYGYDDVQTWNPNVASTYMSPYMQNVVDVQKAQAQLDFDRAQAGRDATAVQQGAFGGTRSAVVDALAQEDLARQMGEIQALGQQQAYQDAASQFQADRAALFGLDTARADEFGRYMAQGQAENQFAGDLDFQRERLMADLLGQGTQLSAGIGADLLNLGAAEREAVLQDAELREQIGADIEATQQGILDMGYEDYLRQQAYPQEQLAFYSALMQGIPVSPSFSQQTYMARSPYQDALGAGLSALGLYQGMQ